MFDGMDVPGYRIQRHEARRRSHPPTDHASTGAVRRGSGLSRGRAEIPPSGTGGRGWARNGIEDDHPWYELLGLRTLPRHHAGHRRVESGTGLSRLSTIDERRHPFPGLRVRTEALRSFVAPEGPGSARFYVGRPSLSRIELAMILQNRYIAITASARSERTSCTSDVCCRRRLQLPRNRGRHYL